MCLSAYLNGYRNTFTINRDIFANINFFIKLFRVFLGIEKMSFANFQTNRTIVREVLQKINFHFFATKFLNRFLSFFCFLLLFLKIIKSRFCSCFDFKFLSENRLVYQTVMSSFRLAYKSLFCSVIGDLSLLTHNLKVIQTN